VKLAPKDPPGRSTRRARGFATDIGQLRAQGYTFEAIRQALAEAGVKVSKSTVQREVARLESGSSSGLVAAAEPPTHVHAAAPAPSPATPSSASGLPSGKDIAEAFASTWNANPLFRQRSIE
jgi:ribosomal protein L12E/L44/L45/RPP1/RPP2